VVGNGGDSITVGADVEPEAAWANRLRTILTMLGMVIGDSATYVANHSIHDDALLRDLTARSSLAANLDIIIQ
jgi:hypothetical protein